MSPAKRTSASAFLKTRLCSNVGQALRSFGLFVFGVASGGYVVSLGQQWLHGLECGLAGVEDALEVLRGIHRMGHDPVKRGKVVIAEGHAARAAEGLKRLLADADVQAEHAGAIQVRDAVIVVVGGGQRRERESMVIAIKEERVSEVLGGLDIGERLDDALRDFRFVHDTSERTNVYPASS